MLRREGTFQVTDAFLIAWTRGDTLWWRFRMWELDKWVRGRRMDVEMTLALVSISSKVTQLKSLMGLWCGY